MNADLADHPFSPENIASESASESTWLRWLGTAERLLGHSLDGDGAGCGYSIDEAWEAFVLRTTAHAYVAMVTSRDRYDGGAFVRA